LGQLCLLRGELKLAEDHADQVLAMSDPPADILRQLLAQYLRVCVAMKSGVEPEQFVIMENILGFTQYINAQPYSAMALLTLAEMHLGRQGLAQAENNAQQALSLAETCHLQREACTALRLLAEIKAQQHDLVASEGLILNALALAEAIQAPYEIGRCLRTKAASQTDPNTAIDDAKHALELFAGIGALYEAQQTRILLGNLTANDPHEAINVRPS
jgi:hypothetical protein